MTQFQVIGLQEITIPFATETTDGTVVVPTSSGLTVDAEGNLGVSTSISIPSNPASGTNNVTIDQNGNVNSTNGLNIQTSVGVSATAQSFTFNVPTQGANPGGTMTLASSGPGIEPNGALLTVDLISAQGINSSGNVDSNGINCNGPANISGPVTLNGNESNSATQTVFNVADGSTITVLPTTNCLFLTTSGDLNSLTINLPAANVQSGGVVEVAISGNVSSLTWAYDQTNPPLAPVLGVPTSVSGYAAVRLRGGQTLPGITGEISIEWDGYFRVA
jgi:hypothetical protein